MVVVVLVDKVAAAAAVEGRKGARRGEQRSKCAKMRVAAIVAEWDCACRGSEVEGLTWAIRWRRC